MPPAWLFSSIQPTARAQTKHYGALGRIGLQTKVLKASTSAEIDAAFMGLVHERGDDVYGNDVLFVSADALFQSHSQQLVALTARDRIAAAYPDRATVAAGGLMNYGTDIFEMYRQIGLYTEVTRSRPGVGARQRTRTSTCGS
jgi:ABC-type uncharacterized transport system substrate-binding protein